jgi:hypothetical protein
MLKNASFPEKDFPSLTYTHSKGKTLFYRGKFFINFLEWKRGNEPFSFPLVTIHPLR